MCGVGKIERLMLNRQNEQNKVMNVSEFVCPIPVDQFESQFSWISYSGLQIKPIKASTCKSRIEIQENKTFATKY